MHNRFFLSSVSLAALAALAAAAAAETVPEQVVVTATRTAEQIEVTGQSMSVITAEDIAKRQLSFAGDILSATPGITAVRNGGAGQNVSLLVRGAEAGQTLVLVDGIRLNDPSATSGFALVGDILANGLDRVEVLRGPQSTLYGSEAIGGVVNMLTKRGGPLALTAMAEAGSFDTVHLNAAASGSYQSFEFGAAANLLTTNSVSAADARDGNSEADGYHHVGATANLRWNASDTVSVDARLYYTKARDSFDGYPAPAYTYQDTHQYGTNELLAFYGGVNVDAFDGRLSNRLAVIHSDADRKTFDTTEDFWAKGGATRLEYQGSFKLDDANEIVFGAEHERTGLDTQSLYDAAPITGSDTLDSGYIHWQSTVLPGVTLTAGGRYDHDREFGDHTSFKLAAAWAVIDGTTLRATMGDGFKAPSLYQLFSPYSNPVETLKPETATGWEAGVDQRLGNWQASLTYFERRTANQIDFFSCWGVSSTACTARTYEGGYYYNVDRSRAKGVEVALSGKLTETLRLSFNYTNLTDEDLSTGLQLARRPHDSANAVATWTPLAALTLGAELGYVGSRFNDAYHYSALKETALVKLFASYKLTDAVEVFGRLENLGDTLNQPVSGYGTPGRAFYAGLRTTL